jgi:hypothetical protein
MKPTWAETIRQWMSFGAASHSISVLFEFIESEVWPAAAPPLFATRQHSLAICEISALKDTED